LKLPGLKEARELRGWSQQRLAEESGVSRDGISNYETGHRDAWPATARRLADALDVEIEELVHPKAGRRSSPNETAAAASRTEESLLDKALDAARQDEEKDARVMAREDASEGLAAEVVSGYEEDKFRAELRTLGFPDKHFEDFIWPLVIRSVRAERLEQENARLREEAAKLREQVASVE
jgi:transcriptional regulator with XRE-family HTH domain